jgi:predicted Rossmann fold flavoprotein
MFHGKDLLEFFELHQVRLVKRDGFHYFPESYKASDVVNMWICALKELHVEVRTGCCVDKLIIEDNFIRGIGCRNETLFFDRAVLCCGGKSYPALGGLGRGYRLAQQAGHTVTALYPAMTGIKCREEWVKQCSGISLDDVSCYIDLKRDRRNIERGELLFTRNGFSAFAVLDLAGRVAQLLDGMSEVPLVVDFLPRMETAELEEVLETWRKEHGRKSISSLLTEYFPRRLAEYLCDNKDVPAAQLKRLDAERLLANIKKHTFQICGVESWDKAMVTLGGVSLKEIYPDTLQSRIVSGLYFAGELLDVTGRCGGYNITWAMASGMCAGTSAAE